MSRLLKDALKVAAATLVLLLLIEATLRIVYYVRNSSVDYVPLPYMAGGYGPIPPWVDGLRILEPDEVLIWKLRPNLRRKYIDVFSPVQREEDRTSLLRQFKPVVPDSLKDNPTWEIALNSDGFRDEEFPAGKSSSSLRIVCLGDSWTFGANVGQDKSYPELLSRLLKAEMPERGVEVFNLGVLGYSSFQGLELLKRKALDLRPDVVLIGFAMNDSGVAGYRDKDIPSFSLMKLAHVAEHVESFKLLRYIIQVSRYDAKPMTERLRAMADPASKNSWEVWGSPQSLEEVDYEKLEPWTRVAPQDYEKNLREMVALIRNRGARPVFVYNELRRQSPYLSIMTKISLEAGVPLVDGSALIDEAKRRIENELEEKLGLQPSADVATVPVVAEADNGEDVEVIFRVYMGEYSVPNKVFIVGAHEKLGDGVPNRIAMYDDGTHGDEIAKDNVWSLATKIARGTKLFYVYTNSGEPGQWEGLDVPQIRNFSIETASAQKVYKPIESFGKIYMQADGWHTNAKGYELIADAIRERSF